MSSGDSDGWTAVGPSRFCSNCGAPIQTGTVFCPRCGIRILHPPEQQSASASMPSGMPDYSSPASFPEVKKSKAKRNVIVVAVLLIVVLLIGLGISYFVSPLGGSKTTTTSAGVTQSTTATGTGSSIMQTLSSSSSGNSLIFQPGNPDITNSSANVSYPSNYTTLADYALSLINKDRATFGLPSVVLSKVDSGQQHADSMLYYGYFSHWDVQGYKPYMRYTLLGGTGSVEENVAFNYCIRSSDIESTSIVQPVPCTIQTIENSLNGSEWAMMYNDALCCDNGHRNNTLDSAHTSVSIGISYNITSEAVFFVEDYENNYLNFTTLSYSNNLLSMQGSMIRNVDLTPWIYSGDSISAGALFYVFYDPTLQPINSLPAVSCLSEGSSCLAYQQCASQSEINETATCTYWGGYNEGTFLGWVQAPCPANFQCSSQYQGYQEVYATMWQSSGQSPGSSFTIQFSLSSFIQQNGNGIYTLYLIPNNSNYTVTSYSVFVG